MTNRLCLALLLLAGCLTLWYTSRAAKAPYLTDDSFQYLDAAEQLRSGACLCTRVAHFDEQIALGRLPVPLTHFPPGYSLLISALSWVFSFEYAGFVLSAGGFLVTLWLIWDIGLTLGAKPWAIVALDLLWATNSHALLDAARVGTEALFTAMLAAIAALMVRDIRGDGQNRALIVYMGMLAGFAYWIRYAALFIVPVIGAYILWRWWRTRATRWWALAALLAEAALVAAIQIRNIIYTGSWRGGFATSDHMSLKAVLIESIKATYHLVFGDRVVVRLDFWSAVSAALIAVVLALSILSWRKRQYAPAPKFLPAALGWIAFLCSVYIVGVILSAMMTIATDLLRFYRPLYPLVLAVAAVLLSLVLTGMRRAPVLALVAAILVIHSRSLVVQGISQQVPVNEMLSLDVQPGLSGRAWLLSHVPPSGAVVAVNGQALHYLLGRDVISVITPDSTTRHEDGQSYQALMRQYHARYLVLFPGLPSHFLPEQDEIPFLRELAAASPHYPDWLQPAVRNSGLAVYECQVCAQ